MRVLLLLAATVAACSALSHNAREIQRMKAFEAAGVESKETSKRMAEATEALKRQTGRKNVLWFLVDDFRPQIQHYLDAGLKSFDSPKMHTPNIDALCKRSLVLLKHYVQQSICSPSRTVAATGRRPDTTRVYALQSYWRDMGGDFDTIPQYFKENGYKTMGMGKFFHDQRVSKNYDQEHSWTKPYYYPVEGYHFYKMGHDFPWEVIDEQTLKDHPFPDTQFADKAIEYLNELAQTPDEPWFMSVGFIKPHLPFVAAQKYFDLYPLEDIKLPENNVAPQALPMPDITWDGVGAVEVDSYLPAEYQGALLKQNYDGLPDQNLPDVMSRNMRRAYYAGVSSTDFELGRVVDELERLGLSDNTVIALWGDHGFSLGEHSHWTKMSARELANHSPLFFAVPGRTDAGIDTEELAETVDIFPTLVEAAGLPLLPECPEDSSDVKTCTEGSSLLPLIDAPTTPVKTAAFSQFPKYVLDGAGVFLARYMGYSIRTDRYRYTEYIEFGVAPEYTQHWDKVMAIELYDYDTDPQENVNVAADFPALCGELSKELRAGYMPARLT